MKLFILGATGGTGRQLVTQALARGHDVTALVRSPDRLPLLHERLTVLSGDPRRPEHLARLPGHDAVVSALGLRDRRPSTLLGDAARATVEAMRRAGVRRLLVVSVAMIFPDAGITRLLGPPLRRVLRHTVRDTIEMEAVVRASALDWTIARPPRLTDGAPRGRYRAEAGRLPPRGLAIPRADLARYLLDATERGLDLGAVVGVTG